MGPIWNSSEWDRARRISHRSEPAVDRGNAARGMVEEAHPHGPIWLCRRACRRRDLSHQRLCQLYDRRDDHRRWGIFGPGSLMAQVIDSHHHFWKYSPQEYSWIGEGQSVLKRNFLPADLKNEVDAAGVNGVLSVQARQSLEETRWLLELAEKNDFI